MCLTFKIRKLYFSGTFVKFDILLDISINSSLLLLFHIFTSPSLTRHCNSHNSFKNCLTAQKCFNDSSLLHFSLSLGFLPSFNYFLTPFLTFPSPLSLFFPFRCSKSTFRNKRSASPPSPTFFPIQRVFSNFLFDE